MPSTKRCTKCGEVKSLDEFNRHRSKPLGRRSDCRACQREYNRTWREANREYFREYYAANRDRKREYSRAWREANLDRHREYNRAWREANLDRHREYDREYYAANRARKLEYQRARYEANRDRVREYNRAWYEANRDRVREYRAANRYRFREYNRRRRARKRATAVEEFTPADVYAWWEELGAYNCFWCDLPFTENDRIHVDHVWPLSRGGHHAVRNLVPACERCNRSKGSTLPHEFEERAYEEWLDSASG